MTARDDYQLYAWHTDVETIRERIKQFDAMCDEIDRLRAALDRLRQEAR